jgi:hypothetical protein
MQKVETRKTLLIKHDVNASKEWSEYINVGFVADEMIVRSALYVSAGAEENTPYYVSCSLLSSDDALCVVVDGGGYNNSQNSFLIGKLVQGSTSFKVLNVDGTVSAGAGKLMISLEFIKYKTS